MKVKPETVAVGPPIFGAPFIHQKGKGAKSFDVPKGICQRWSPVFKSIAVGRVPYKVLIDYID